MLRWLFLLPVVYGTNIVFDSVSNLGNSPTHLREDPTDTYSMILNGKSFVLARGNGSVWTSNDAGKHFVRTPSVAAPVPSCPLNLSSRASIGHVGYLTEPATNFTFNASTVWTATGTGIHSVPEEGRPVHWVGLPFQTLLFSIESGGVTALPDGTLIATVVTWPAPSPPSPSPYPTPPGPCCNGTVVVYASTDQGMTWQFRAVVADKASVGTEEGPNENNIVTLKDGKTLWLIIRVDGGDGVPDHPHVPYMVTTSTDGGFTWTKLTSLPPELMSAKPKATVLSPIGALVVSGGRPALNLWVSLDGRGETWESYDIPTVHNAIVAAPSDKFCTEFENATTALGWAQSSGYTTVNAVGDDAGVVCYQRQGFGSGGYRKPIPKDCAVDFSTTFCLRFQVKSAVDQS